MSGKIQRVPGELTSESFSGVGRNSTPNTQGALEVGDRVREAVQAHIGEQALRSPVVLKIDADRVPIAPNEPLNFLHLSPDEQDAHLASVRGLWTPEEEAEFKRILDQARAIGADSVRISKR